MDQFIQFVIRHWLLSGAFLVVLILLIIEELKKRGLGSPVSPQAAVNLMNHEQAVVVDIRDKTAFSNSHIINAINIPQADLERGLNKLEKYKQRLLIVACTSGQKSQAVAVKLRKNGFEKACALAGGVNAWKNADLPLVKGK